MFLHRELDPLDLVHAQHVRHDHVADLQGPRGAAELDPARRLGRVKGRGIGGVDVDEPVGGTEVGDLADHRIAPLGNVPPVQRDHADEPVLLVPNPQLRREKLSAFAVRSMSRLQSGAADGFARTEYRVERPASLPTPTKPPTTRHGVQPFGATSCYSVRLRLAGTPSRSASPRFLSSARSTAPASPSAGPRPSRRRRAKLPSGTTPLSRSCRI